LLDDANNGDSKNKKYSEGIINETSLDADEEKSPSQPKQHEVLTDEPKTARLLAFVQILTASFASFAHGSNDVRLVQICFSGSTDTNHDSLLQNTTYTGPLRLRYFSGSSDTNHDSLFVEYYLHWITIRLRYIFQVVQTQTTTALL
jgi:hypothetical protein